MPSLGGVELPTALGGKKKEPETKLDHVKTKINKARASIGDSATAQSIKQATGTAKNESMCPKLTWQQRLYGCAGCFCVGCALSLGGWISWQTGRIALFAIYYTLGNIISICGSGFLLGPKRQCKNMFKAKRIWATCIYFTMILATLVSAFLSAHVALVLLFIFVQWCALMWYIASYIPYGQKMIKRFFSKNLSFE